MTKNGLKVNYILFNDWILINSHIQACMKHTKQSSCRWERLKLDVENEGVAHVRHEWEEQQIYSEHCCLVTCPVSAGWPLRVASQLTETLSIHSCSERVRLLLQLYRPSFSRSPALLSWDLLLPSTFQLRLQSDGKPLLATHTSVAVFFEEISALEGGRTLTLGRVTPDKHTTLNSVKKKAFLSFQVQKKYMNNNTVIKL